MKPIPRIYLIRIKYILLLLLCALGFKLHAPRIPSWDKIQSNLERMLHRSLWLLFFLFLLCISGGSPLGPLRLNGASQITLSIFVTNSAAHSNNITFNGVDTRFAVTNITNAAKQWSVTNTVPWSASNLFAHLNSSKPLGVPSYTVTWSTTNANALWVVAPLNSNFTASASGNWASLGLGTNTFGVNTQLTIPKTNFSITAQSNLVSGLVDWLNGYPRSSETISGAAPIMSQFASTGLVQSLWGKTIRGVTNIDGRATNIWLDRVNVFAPTNATVSSNLHHWGLTFFRGNGTTSAVIVPHPTSGYPLLVPGTNGYTGAYLDLEPGAITDGAILNYGSARKYFPLLSASPGFSLSNYWSITNYFINAGNLYALGSLSNVSLLGSNFAYGNFTFVDAPRLPDGAITAGLMSEDMGELWFVRSLAEGKVPQTIVRYSDFSSNQFTMNPAAGTLSLATGVPLTNAALYGGANRGTLSFGNYTAAESFHGTNAAFDHLTAAVSLRATNVTLSNVLAHFARVSSLLLAGSNWIDGTLAFQQGAYTALGNGGGTTNIVQLSTNTVTVVSGNTADANIISLKDPGARFAITINGSAFNQTYLHESPLETVEERRMKLPSSLNVTIGPNGGALWVYNTTDLRWALLAHSGPFTASATNVNQQPVGATNATHLTLIVTNHSNGTLQQKTLSTGAGITFSNTPTNIVIAATADVTTAQLNTASNFLARSLLNYIPLPVQSYKAVSSNAPSLDAASYQAWALSWPYTNGVGSNEPLCATWSFNLPDTYATNTLALRGWMFVNATNGPNESNVCWRVSVLRLTTNATDIAVGGYQPSLLITSAVPANYQGTNLLHEFAVSLGTNVMMQAGEMGVLKLERVGTNDTYRTGAALLTRLQLEYSR